MLNKEEGRVLKPCDKNIQRTLDLARKMMALADQGDASREDIGCGILYGVLRDAAYKIRRLAEIEKQKHQAKTDGMQAKRNTGKAERCIKNQP